MFHQSCLVLGQLLKEVKPLALHQAKNPWQSNVFRQYIYLEPPALSLKVKVSQKSLAKQSVRVVHLIGTPCTKRLWFNWKSWWRKHGRHWHLTDMSMNLTIGVYHKLAYIIHWHVPDIGVYQTLAWTRHWRVPDISVYKTLACTWHWRVPGCGLFLTLAYTQYKLVPKIWM